MHISKSALCWRQVSPFQIFTLTFMGTFRGRECNGPVPEGPAIKNKWKVHGEVAPVGWKVCQENTDSRILFEWIKAIKQFSEKRVKRESERLTTEFFLMWIPLACAVTQRQQLLFIKLNEGLHFDAANPVSGSPLLDIFNMESQLHPCTVKPKDIIFHSLHVVAPQYSSFWKIMWPYTKGICLEGCRRCTLLISQCKIFTVLFNF